MYSIYINYLQYVYRRRHTNLHLKPSALTIIRPKRGTRYAEIQIFSVNPEVVQIATQGTGVVQAPVIVLIVLGTVAVPQPMSPKDRGLLLAVSVL